MKPGKVIPVRVPETQELQGAVVHEKDATLVKFKNINILTG